MSIYKKLILFVLVLILAVVAYQYIRKQAVKNIPNQDEVSSEAEDKSLCEKQLEIQPDNKRIEIFEGTPKQVDFSTMPEAKTYYTVITTAAASGPNFAGHFTLAKWGCGTSCFVYAIIDAATGEIVAYSGANENYYLRDYSLDRNVLVMDPEYAGQEIKYYKMVEGEGEKSHLDLVCTDVAKEDMFGLPE